ncbi:MAG: DUF6948 domain-containing protein [Methylocystis sp.]|uniref:DUF6948 domain-containing protein n=1 Tax=Methylocystis sp. TaxID=1911079 RepID=UPI003DA4CDB9
MDIQVNKINEYETHIILKSLNEGPSAGVHGHCRDGAEAFVPTRDGRAIPINIPRRDMVDGAAFTELKPLSTRTEGDLRPVIVRCEGKLAYFGKLEAYDGRLVWLKDARLLMSVLPVMGEELYGVARCGLIRRNSRIDVAVPSVLLLNACEIIDASEEAAKSIEAP